MKKFLLFFILSATLLSLNAQTLSKSIDKSAINKNINKSNTAFSVLESNVEFEKDTITVDTITTGEERIIEIFLTNKGNETANLYWKIETIAFNDDWTYLICDSKNCYPPKRNHSSKNNPNVLEPDSTQFWSFHFNDKFVADTGLLLLKMYDDKEFSNVVDSVYLVFKTRFNTGVNDVSNDRLFVFPNPASDYFNVLSKSEVSKVEIYNLIGKKVKTIQNTNSDRYDISDLRNGIYLVRVLDKSSKALKVIRLNVTKSRP